jgi:ABC-type lipoprotein release transport system permease subunit
MRCTARGLGTVIARIFANVRYATENSQTLSSVLFGMTTRDPVTFMGVAGLLFAVSIVAVLIAALRATRVDPLVALRNEDHLAPGLAAKHCLA